MLVARSAAVWKTVESDKALIGDTAAALLPLNDIGQGDIDGVTRATRNPRMDIWAETVKSADVIIIDMSLPAQNAGVESDRTRDRAAGLRARIAIQAVTTANDVLAHPNPQLVPARLARTEIGRTEDLTD